MRAERRLRLAVLLGQPLPARYVHRPADGFAAGVGALRARRAAAPRLGERWQGSNLV